MAEASSIEKRPSSIGDIWRAPLVPVALAGTAGVILDRYFSIPLPVSLVGAVVALAAWAAARLGRSNGLPLVYLAAAIVALGAAYHQVYRNLYAADDIGSFATPEPRPAR